MQLTDCDGIASEIIKSTASIGFGEKRDLCEGRGNNPLIGDSTTRPQYGFDSKVDRYYERRLANSSSAKC
jgi:hypothetical protein